MALNTSPHAPSLSVDAIAEGVRTLLPHGSLTPLGRNVTLDELSVTAPIAVYEVHPTNFRSGLLATAQANKWRSLLVHGTAAVGWVSFLGEGQYKVADVAVNDYAASLVEGLRMGEQLAADRDFEIRILESRGHGLGAVWLHAPDRDVIIPVLAAGRVVPFRTYDEATLTATLDDTTSCMTFS